MFKIKNKNGKMMELSKDTIFSFYNDTQDLLCIFVVSFSEVVSGSLYLFNSSYLPENLDYANGTVMMDLIKNGNPFMLMTYSQDSVSDATIDDVLCVLKSLEFSVDIELNSDVDDSIIYN